MDVYGHESYYKYDTKIGTCTYLAYTTKVVFFVPGFEKGAL
jgi:hypothetical protein